MRCSIKSFYPYILEKARFGSVWCTVKMIFPTSQMPSQSKFSQINHITRTNQIMLSNTLISQINRSTRTNQTMLSITIKKSSRFLLRIKIGQGWIRTTVDSRRQIYSLLPLATRPPTHLLFAFDEIWTRGLSLTKGVRYPCATKASVSLRSAIKTSRQ